MSGDFYVVTKDRVKLWKVWGICEHLKVISVVLAWTDWLIGGKSEVLDPAAEPLNSR